MFQQAHISPDSSFATAAAQDVISSSQQTEVELQSAQKFSLQCKLSVGSLIDPLEHEADAMADTVIRMPEQSFIQRKCSNCEEEEKVQRKPLISFIQRKESLSGSEAPQTISNQKINTLKGEVQKTNQSNDETQGIRIRFKDKEGVLQYLFYKIDMELNTGNRFADETIKSLNTLYNDSPTAKGIILEAMNLGNIVIIKFTSKDEEREYDPWANDKKGIATGDISWNPYIADIYSIPDPEKGTKVQSPALTLIHELIHFVEHGKKLNDVINKIEGAEKDLQDYLWEKGKYADLQQEEDDVKIESQIAKELHMGTRPDYRERGKKTITEDSVSVKEVTDQETKNKKLGELKIEDKRGAGQIPLQKKEEKNETLQRKIEKEYIHSTDIVSWISKTKGCGSSMESNTQSFMQSRFGADFSDVKIHTGSEAIQMNRELSAKAFTVGNDIYFNEGQYNPNSNNGKQLLAHELTHTVQQNGSVKTIQRQSAGSAAPVVPAPPRQDVCYLMGNDTFHRVATRFFRARFPQAIFVSNLTNLQALLNHLNTTFSAPLGNVFIVSHANEDGTLAFGLNARDRDNHLGVVELRNALHPTGGGPSSLTDVSHLVDDQTRIQIKGCDLGRNQQVVELFDEAFGGAGVVTAPTHEQAYSSDSPAAIRAATAEAMRTHLAEFEQDLPDLPSAPAPIPRGMRGDDLRKARAEFNAARRLRAAAQRKRRSANAAERRSFAAEASRLGNMEGTHEALSGPMFQRPGTGLFTVEELQPQINSLYPHLSEEQRINLANRLVAPDRRPRARAMSQGVFHQSGQRAYSYSSSFRSAAPQNLQEARLAFARMFRRSHFTPVSVIITPTISGTTTVFEYAFTGHDTRRGHTSDDMTFNASSAPVESDAALIAQVQAQVNNPDKFNWRVEENRNGSGMITKNVIRERVVAYLHHGSLNASRGDYFAPPESDRRFFAASAFER